MKIAKIALMGFLAFLSWSVNWVLLKQGIYQDTSTVVFVGWQALATVIGIVFLTFFFLVNKNRIVSICLDILIFISYLLIMPKSFYVVLGGGIFLAFLLFFEQRLSYEQKNTIDFSMRRVMSGSTMLILYALMLLVGLNVYYNTQTDFKANPDVYYSRLEQATLRTAPYVTKNFPELSEEQKSQLNQQLATETLNKIKASANGYEKYFPFIFALIVTALLWTFAFIIYWISVVVGWILFRLLLLIGFFRLEPEMVEVKKLTI